MIVKIGIIGILAVVFGIFFKNVKQEYTLYIGIAGALLIAIIAISYLIRVLNGVEALQAYIEKSGQYLKMLLKMVGITYICEFTSSICKDAGYQAMAGQIDVFGKICVIMVGFPIVQALFELLGKFSL
ncbi:MAG: stage III sporulation protein AD [Lachnospiraceae bacterium]|nr:stage III sporulation protein AD [Lachnospiraceae bacterium]